MLTKCTIALVLAAMFSFAGCPTNNDSGSAPNDETATAKGGKINLPLTIAGDDPALVSLDFSDPRLFALARCIGLPLVKSDSAAQLTPGLASSWESTDFITWKFKLAALPAFAGEPDHAARLFETRVRALLTGDESSLRAQIEDLVTGASDYASGTATDISGIEFAGGELTIALTRKFAQFPLWLSQPGLSLVEGNPLDPPPDPASTPALGCAPFCVSAVDAEAIVLKLNAQSLYDSPQLEEIRFMLEPDPVRQAELFIAGELDAANLPDGQLEELNRESGRVEQLRTAEMIYGLFDLHQFPWGDSQFQSKLGLRQALNLALNRNTIAEENAGCMEPWPHFFPEALRNNIPAGLIHQPTFPPEEQMEEAGMALRRADHWQGNHLIPGMDLTYLESQRIDGVAVSVLEFWNDISVRMRPHQTTMEDLRVRVGLGTHEIILYKFSPPYADAGAFAYPLLFSAFAGLDGNWQMLSDPQVDTIITETQATEDALLREKKFQELSQYLEDNALLVFIGYSTPSIAISNRLAGLKLSPYDFDASLAGQDFSKLGVAGE